MFQHAAKMSTEEESGAAKVITQAVHEADGKICGRSRTLAVMPILRSCSASAIQAPINPFKPKELDMGIQRVDDYVNCAALDQRAGYDGVEIMARVILLTSSSSNTPTTVPTSGVAAMKPHSPAD